ncbi:hypothetical protein B7486_55310, partial [cyanobacterium TDX16]
EPADPFEVVSVTEDVVLDRLVDLPAPASYEITGTAVGVPGAELDALVGLAAAPPADPSVQATSTFSDLPAFGPAMAVDGDPRTSWVADIGDAFPALALQWDQPRTIDALRLQLPGPPALAAEQVIVTVDGEDRTLPIAEDGTVDLDGVVTDQLRLALDVADLEGRVFGLVGISEVEVLPAAGDATPAPDPATVPVELPCGRGPEVVIDGETTSTAVRGTLEDLQRLQPLELEACATVELADGEHRITGPATSALQVQSLVLDPEPPQVANERRSVEVETWDTEHRRVEVGEGSTTTLLTLAENANAGWQATLDGEVLEPAVVDGWRQAWVVPAGQSGVVELRFEPGRTYDLMLGVGLLLALLVVGLAWVRPRGSRGAVATAAAAVRARAVPDLVIVLVGTVGLGLAAGPLALLVPVTWIVLRWPALRVVLPVACLGAVGVLMGIDRVVFSPELGWQGQALTGFALAAAIVGPAVWPRPRRDRPEVTARPDP